MKMGEKQPITIEFTSRQGEAKLFLSWAWAGQVAAVVPASAISHKEPPKIKPKELDGYGPGEWLECVLGVDCAAGRYSLKVNGREALREAGFAEPSPMVYAISFRTGEYRGNPGERAERDIPNSEEPVAKAVYRIDDVRTGNP
jgi:hypothetical protein